MCEGSLKESSSPSFVALAHPSSQLCLDVSSVRTAWADFCHCGHPTELFTLLMSALAPQLSSNTSCRVMVSIFLSPGLCIGSFLHLHAFSPDGSLPALLLFSLLEVGPTPTLHFHSSHHLNYLSSHLLYLFIIALLQHVNAQRAGIFVSFVHQGLAQAWHIVGATSE